MMIYHYDKSCLVIVPIYNEKDNIGLLLECIFADFYIIEVLIVGDASPDGTGDLVAMLQLKYKKRLHLFKKAKKVGLATTYIAGLEFALAGACKYILTMNADLSYPPDKLRALYIACKEEGYDVAIGPSLY